MPPLVGRDPELATIDRFLRSVGEGYQAVVFRGGAGYGKSALLEETVVRARAAGFRALTARPAETEAELPFGVLAELLEPVGMSELELPAPQARALNVALRRVDPDEARPVDPLGLSLAVVAALRELAKEEPLLVALDDLQWCDPPSLRTLEFALRRVESEQIGLAAGLRSGDGPEIQIPAANGHLTAVEVGPLDAGAFEAVVRRGNRLPRPVLRQLYVACDGNPLFGKEVAALLAEHGLPDDPAALIPVPPSASDAIGRRVAKLGLDTRDVLLGAAALPRPTVDVLLAAYGERRLEDALAEAAAAGIVVVDRERVRFSHPLVAAAVYEAATPARRRAAHAALARALDRAEERAPQLALATTSASAAVAAELEAAAAAAKARGALDAAGRLLEQAATITPVRDRAARRRRGLEAARFHLAAGDTERARSLLDRLLQFSQPGEERAEVLLELALADGSYSQRGLDYAYAALEQAQQSPALAIRIHYCLGELHVSCRRGRAVRRARARRAHDRRDARRRGYARGDSRLRRIRRLHRRQARQPGRARAVRRGRAPSRQIVDYERRWTERHAGQRAAADRSVRPLAGALPRGAARRRRARRRAGADVDARVAGGRRNRRREPPARAGVRGRVRRARRAAGRTDDSDVRPAGRRHGLRASRRAGRGRDACARRSGARAVAGARPLARVGRPLARPRRARPRRACRGAGALRGFRAAQRRGRLHRSGLQTAAQRDRGADRARPPRRRRRADRRVRGALLDRAPRARSGAGRPLQRARRLAPRRARARGSGVRTVARATGAGAEPVRARTHADGPRDGAPAAPKARRRAASPRGGGRALRALRRRRSGPTERAPTSPRSGYDAARRTS